MADIILSVGAGDVLRNLISSGTVHITRLATIFRQASASLIITNAHRINQGQMPDLTNKGNDFFIFQADDPDAAADLVVDVVQNRIPKKFGFHPINEVQVLSPMYRGVIGVQALNERLQATLNPPGPGDYRVFNQFTQQFAVNELADVVQRAGAEYGLDVKVEHIENPRVENEEHYYNAKHSALLDLGLKPHYLSETLVESMFSVIERYKDRVITSAIMPRTRWRPERRVSEPVA